MQKIIDALESSGGKNVTTSTVSLSPGYTPEGQPDGYVAVNTVTAEFGLGAAGEAIDAAVAAGANTIYGPTFTNSDRAKLYGKALEAAVADAKAHAQVLAAATGRTLGAAITVSESSSAPGPLYAKAEAETPRRRRRWCQGRRRPRRWSRSRTSCADGSRPHRPVPGPYGGPGGSMP